MDEARRDVLDASYAYMQKWIQRMSQIAAELREDGTESLETLSDGMDGIPWMIDILVNTRDICGIDPPYVYIKDAASELLIRFENRDYAAAAQVLEERYIPMVAGWLETVETVLEHDGGADINSL